MIIEDLIKKLGDSAATKPLLHINTIHVVDEETTDDTQLTEADVKATLNIGASAQIDVLNSADDQDSDGICGTPKSEPDGFELQPVLRYEPETALVKYRVAGSASVGIKGASGLFGFGFNAKADVAMLTYCRHPDGKLFSQSVLDDAQRFPVVLLANKVLKLDLLEAVALLVGGTLSFNAKVNWADVMAPTVSVLSKWLPNTDAIAIDVGLNASIEATFEVTDEYRLIYYRERPGFINVALRKAKSKSKGLAARAGFSASFHDPAVIERLGETMLQQFLIQSHIGDVDDLLSHIDDAAYEDQIAKLTKILEQSELFTRLAELSQKWVKLKDTLTTAAGDLIQDLDDLQQELVNPIDQVLGDWLGTIAKRLDVDISQEDIEAAFNRVQRLRTDDTIRPILEVLFNELTVTHSFDQIDDLESRWNALYQRMEEHLDASLSPIKAKITNYSDRLKNKVQWAVHQLTGSALATKIDEFFAHTTPPATVKQIEAFLENAGVLRLVRGAQALRDKLDTAKKRWSSLVSEVAHSKLELAWSFEYSSLKQDTSVLEAMVPDQHIEKYHADLLKGRTENLLLDMRNPGTQIVPIRFLHEDTTTIKKGVNISIGLGRWAILGQDQTIIQKAVRENIRGEREVTGVGLRSYKKNWLGFDSLFYETTLGASTNGYLANPTAKDMQFELNLIWTGSHKRTSKEDLDHFVDLACLWGAIRPQDMESLDLSSFLRVGTQIEVRMKFGHDAFVHIAGMLSVFDPELFGKALAAGMGYNALIPSTPKLRTRVYGAYWRALLEERRHWNYHDTSFDPQSVQVYLRNRGFRDWLTLESRGTPTTSVSGLMARNKHLVGEYKILNQTFVKLTQDRNPDSDTRPTDNATSFVDYFKTIAPFFGLPFLVRAFGYYCLIGVSDQDPEVLDQVETSATITATTSRETKMLTQSLHPRLHT